MSTTVLTLWIIAETDLARLYSRIPLHKVTKTNRFEIWIPKSIIEHTTKRGTQHEVTLPDWFIEKKGL